MKLFRDILLLIGFVSFLLAFACKIASAALLWLRPVRTIEYYNRSSKSWALVGVSTNGIGFECAKELAMRGFNIILFGELQNGLLAGRQQIQDATGGTVQIETCHCDVTKFGPGPIGSRITPYLTYPISILINDVNGIAGTPPYRGFQTPTAKEADNTISMNVRSMSLLTKAILPTLLQNSPSLILNVTSGDRVGIPGAVIYSGAKGFASSFSRALSREMREFRHQVDVISIVTGHAHSFTSEGRDLTVMLASLSGGLPAGLSSKLQSINKRLPSIRHRLPNTGLGRLRSTLALKLGFHGPSEPAKAMIDLAPRAAAMGVLEFSPWF